MNEPSVFRPPLKSTFRNHYHQIPDRKTVKIRLARNTSPIPFRTIPVDQPPHELVNNTLAQSTQASTHARICLIFYLMQCRLSRIPFFFLHPSCQPRIDRRTAIVRHLPLLLLLLFFDLLIFDSLVRMNMSFKQLKNDMPFLFM